MNEQKVSPTAESMAISVREFSPITLIDSLVAPLTSTSPNSVARKEITDVVMNNANIKRPANVGAIAHHLLKIRSATMPLGLETRIACLPVANGFPAARVTTMCKVSLRFQEAPDGSSFQVLSPLGA